MTANTTTALPARTLRATLAATLCACAGLALAQEPTTQTQPAPAAASTPAPTGVTPAAAAPRIEFDTRLVELGVIPDDKEVTRTFTFRNTGNAPLELQQPTGSCGCTVPRLDKLVYQPGESGTISVTYNPHNRNGAQHTVVTVRSNDPLTPTTNLDVKSEVRPLLRLEPMLLNFGPIARGSDSKQVLTISNRLQGVKVEQVIPSSPRLLAKVLETKNTEVNGEQVELTTVEVTLAPGAAAGPLSDAVTIRTSDPARTLTATVMGEVLGDIVASPTQLQFPGLVPGQPIASQIRLTPRNAQAFKVLGAEEVPMTGGEKFFTFEVTEDTSTTPSAWLVKLKGQAPARPGAIRGDVVIKTDSATDPELRVRYFGFTSAPRQSQQQQQPKPPSPWDSNPSSLIPPSGGQ